MDRKVRIVGLLVVAALTAAQAFIAEAATVKAGPYDKVEQVVTRNPDPNGFGTADGTASANVDGSLSTSASVDSTAPAGTIVPYANASLFASGATAVARVIQKMTTTGAGTFTIVANYTSITGSTTFTPNYYDPVVGYYCLDCATSSSYPNAYAAVRATYYPCQWTSVAPTCYPSTYKDHYRYLSEASAGNLSPTVSVSTTFTGAGTLVVTASLVSSASARGTGSADASIAGTLSNITLNP